MIALLSSSQLNTVDITNVSLLSYNEGCEARPHQQPCCFNNLKVFLVSGVLNPNLVIYTRLMQDIVTFHTQTSQIKHCLVISQSFNLTWNFIQDVLYCQNLRYINCRISCTISPHRISTRNGPNIYTMINTLEKVLNVNVIKSTLEQ